MPNNNVDATKSAPKQPRKKRPRAGGPAKRRNNLMQVTDRAIDRLCSLTEDEQLMDSIDIKDLKNLTASVKELLSLSGELGETSGGGVIILPEVQTNDEQS